MELKPNFTRNWQTQDILLRQSVTRQSDVSEKLFEGAK